MATRNWLSLVAAGLFGLLNPGVHAFAAEEFRVGDIAVVAANDVEFGLLGRELARLSEGQRFKVTEVRGSWVGGYVVRDESKKRGWVHRGAMRLAPAGEQWPQDAKAAATVADLRELGAQVEVDGAQRVYSLRVGRTALPDSTWEKLAILQGLVVADFGGSNLGDAALAHVVAIPSIERLYLKGTRVTDAGLAQIGALPKLEVLELAGTSITRAGLESLRALKQLRTLNLDHCRLNDDDLKPLASMPTLEVLVLSGTGVRGDGLVYLKPLSKLRVLNLNESAVQDPGMKHLEGLPSLRMLYVRETAVTTKATDALDLTLHSCAIYH